jgi:hypothetical protein
MASVQPEKFREMGARFARQCFCIEILEFKAAMQSI